MKKLSAISSERFKRRGKLIFMASTNSWDAEAELAPYNASKAALFLLTKTMARENWVTTAYNRTP
jgi:NAD(P)-dependent dehydrogenase (short-subunit alcohol dehydrogenase family)